MTLDQIIDLLGGEAAVAAECSCGLSAVSNWKKRGLPPGRQIEFIRLAKRRGVRLTLDQAALMGATVAPSIGQAA